MLYFDDMRTKYGFDDGNVIPPDAEARRTVYVRALNVLAEKYDSSVRAIAYDRFGVHNWCLILFASLDADLTRFDWHEEDPDNAMQKAIDALDDTLTTGDVDDFVIVRVSISRRFEKFLLGLKGE